MHLVFTRMPGEISYRRRLRPLFLCLCVCDVFRAVLVRYSQPVRSNLVRDSQSMRYGLVRDSQPVRSSLVRDSQSMRYGLVRDSQPVRSKFNHGQSNGQIKIQSWIVNLSTGQIKDWSGIVNRSDQVLARDSKLVRSRIVRDSQPVRSWFCQSTGQIKVQSWTVNRSNQGLVRDSQRVRSKFSLFSPACLTRIVNR